METRYYEVVSIDGDYANLKRTDIESDDLKLVARALLPDDITEGCSYVCTNDAGSIIGTFFYTCGPDIEPTYREITDGSWLDASPYGVVHRIASDGSEKGIGMFCLDWAYAQCGHLRIDTHGDNTVMQNLVKKAGFVHCGTIYVAEDNDPRLAYEKSDKTGRNPD